MSLLAARGVSFSYGAATVLSDVELTVAAGDRTAVVGQTGRKVNAAAPARRAGAAGQRRDHRHRHRWPAAAGAGPAARRDDARLRGPADRRQRGRARHAGRRRGDGRRRSRRPRRAPTPAPLTATSRWADRTWRPGRPRPARPSGCPLTSAAGRPACPAVRPPGLGLAALLLSRLTRCCSTSPPTTSTSTGWNA